MTPDQLDKTLSTIAARAKELRDAGVTGRIQVGDIAFDLGGGEPPSVPAHPEQEPANPLDDPATFGGRMPQPRWRDRPPAGPDDEE